MFLKRTKLNSYFKKEYLERKKFVNSTLNSWFKISYFLEILEFTILRQLNHNYNSYLFVIIVSFEEIKNN